ncbi:hypothetical protein LOZ12_002650 [Ophidiomyces ophidiicola]|uniref:Uncharacterized protein n=1 Tax=Ophidiomyces ophidiicola TaxID=1387563 RepID=A0ACB8UX00_9EURO|nr:hypothetical protein LOZ62_006632 [Ophidiomyces ophidiicola]KAI1961746.1 hypothetical protein LOZ56_006685 [Ophidiomyces ophidiicola]KAI2004869.1 hypothetical protein LOZ50_004036 [Ophidiomyces ophidiicola]KAI2018218.1 hypothetical protein LOZ46_003963 [Ophidiomyces ophidiicola]KAI2041372.1 hypothetical protein LOZ44_006548 [Ophidiomyces ophidiicola]
MPKPAQPSSPTAPMANPSEDQRPRKRKPIRTYHCAFCHHLLMASTREILSLPRRAEPALDRAFILPLPRSGASSKTTTTTTTTPVAAEEAGESSSEPEDDEESEAQRTKLARKEVAAVAGTRKQVKNETTEEEEEEEEAEEDDDEEETDYTLLLSATRADTSAVVVRRADGFEKRVLLRCGRCEVVVGYFLDAVHFATAAGTEVVYILPGAVEETGQLGKSGAGVIEEQEWGGWARFKPEAKARS